MRKLIPVLFCLMLFVQCEKSAVDFSVNPGGSTGTGGSLARFTIVGNYLYTVDKQDLRVFDIASPADPVFKRAVPVGFEIETIYPFKDKLFIGSTSVVHIFSIADPAHPQKLSEAVSPNVLRRCDPVVAKDTVAYATLRASGPCGGAQSILAVFNIKDATKPVQVSATALLEPYGLGYSGNTLYVCSHNLGLVVFDISTAYAPKQVRAIQIDNEKFIDVIPYGDVLVGWTLTGMVLFDITDKQNPELIKKIA